MRTWRVGTCAAQSLAVLFCGRHRPGGEPPKAKGDAAEDAKTEYRAADMLKRGIELLDLKQEERALKLISSVPRMFPASKARFKAYLVLGQHHVEKRNYELAIKQFRNLADSEDPTSRPKPSTRRASATTTSTTMTRRSCPSAA